MSCFHDDIEEMAVTINIENFVASYFDVCKSLLKYAQSANWFNDDFSSLSVTIKDPILMEALLEKQIELEIAYEQYRNMK